VTFGPAAVAFTGYSDVTLTGECITDDVLLNISRVNGVNLTSIKLAGVASVSDAGLVALISSAPLLKQFVLEDAGAGVVGTFVPVMLQVCRQLETLHIEGAEAFSWAQLNHTRAWWPSAHLAQETRPAAVGGTGERAAASSSSLSASGAPSGGSHRENPVSPMGQQQQQQQPHMKSQHHHRLSSSNALNAGGVSDDDAESDDSCNSMGAASDSTSISVPAAGTVALALQLQHTVLQGSTGNDQPSSSSSSSRPLPPPAAALVLTVSGGPARQQVEPSPEQHQLPHPYPCGIPRHQQLRRLHVRFANVDNLQHLIERCPGLTELQLDGPALNIQTAAACCRGLRRLAYLVSSPAELDVALLYLHGMGSLKGLELEVKGVMLSTEQLRVSPQAASKGQSTHEWPLARLCAHRRHGLCIGSFTHHWAVACRQQGTGDGSKSCRVLPGGSCGSCCHPCCALLAKGEHKFFHGCFACLRMEGSLLV
jgi:hypothetical protein